MLEGQVAALDAGVLSAEESRGLLRALRQSDLYRADQHSYMLYPNRSLPGFLEKNVVPAESIEASPFLHSLLDADDRQLVVRDDRGGVHFRGTFRNAGDVETALDELATTRDVSDAERRHVLDTFEAVFDHHAYTGRSGTFFGYEGLGSIYWHMVSKLALATQETFWRAHASGADAETLDGLADAYADIRAGLGGSKSPEVYGAFPADAYSHTPEAAGAKQPGMTGQVKEDILCRWGELGVRVGEGRIVIRPALLRAQEFLRQPATFDSVGVDGAHASLALDADTLAFTLCATPVVYRRADSPPRSGGELAIRLVDAEGASTTVEGNALSREASADVFARTGAIARIEVDVLPER